MLQRLCVFCGSSFGSNAAYRLAAQDTGRMLAERGIELVYGGSKAGLMGSLADACLSYGGRVTGVMPKALLDKGIAHSALSELHAVESMHERKALMADLADAFMALPGGYGTWDEFWEVLTWSQLGLHRKPCALLNVHGYYDAFLAMADRAMDEGFVRDIHRQLVLADTDPRRLIDRLTSYVVPVADKWVDREMV